MYTEGGNMWLTLTHVQHVLVQLGHYEGIQCNTIWGIKQENSAYMNRVVELNWYKNIAKIRYKYNVSSYFDKILL